MPMYCDADSPWSWRSFHLVIATGLTGVTLRGFDGVEVVFCKEKQIREAGEAGRTQLLAVEMIEWRERAAACDRGRRTDVAERGSFWKDSP